MKLIQYRFTPQCETRAYLVGQAIFEFLSAAKDLDVSAIYSDPQMKNGIRRVEVDTNRMLPILAESFAQSYLERIDSSKIAVIKSNITCRFIVFEDDGLVRICHASSDGHIIFGKMAPSIDDVAELMITTDLFDFN